MKTLSVRRTLVVYRLWLNKPGKPDEVFWTNDIAGIDILEVFGEFCRNEKDLIQVSDTERFLMVGTPAQDSDCCFVTVQSGRAGVSGSVINTATAEKSYGYGANEADMVSSRFVLIRRKEYGYALACVERVPNDAGPTVVLSAFEGYIKKGQIRASVNREQVQEEQALKAFKGIEEIEVRRYVRSSDRSEGVIIEPAYISHIVKHKRNMLFPLRLINDIFNDKSSLTAVLGIPDEFDGKEEYKVRLRGKDGSSRAFALDGDLRVPVVEILNESGEAPVADSELINRCREIADGIYDSYGRML